MTDSNDLAGMESAFTAGKKSAEQFCKNMQGVFVVLLRQEQQHGRPVRFNFNSKLLFRIGELCKSRETVTHARQHVIARSMGSLPGQSQPARRGEAASPLLTS